MYFVFIILDNILYFKLCGVCEGPILINLFFGNNISQMILMVILYVWHTGLGYVE